MTYAEIVVNVPIRRTFARSYTEPPVDDDGAEDDGSGNGSGAGDLQAYHYHLPPELEDVVLPGHLVWVPFGAQEVQGFVLRLADRAPLETRAVLRLARPEPVLTPAQLELASWISTYYVAPASEAVRLFLPPGLLAKAGKGAGVRAKREEQIEWVGGDLTLDQSLALLGRDTYGSKALAYVMEHAGDPASVGVSSDEVRTQCELKSRAPIRSLVEKGYVYEDDAGRLRLAGSLGSARLWLRGMRGVEKYAPATEWLKAHNGPVWKSDLYAAVDTSIKDLRDLQTAGLVRIAEQVRFRDPLRGRTYPRTVAPSFTDEQSAVWEKISRSSFGTADENGWRSGGKMFLIHGVTDSGKTEIYLRAIAETLGQGRQAIVLVPEIALTPQTIARFAGRFPGRVTVIHSALSAGERYDVWRMIRDGTFDVVVGPRSALFAPLSRLGLIILDEEHEPSYKQDAEQWGSYKVFYDARTAARKLAELSGSVLIFGTATPSLDSYYLAQRGALTLLRMPRRILGHGDEAGTAYMEMPPVEVVDMRQELRAGNRSVLSRSLQAELLATLDAQEQAILFLNRRGASTFVMCRDCGAVAECTRCDAPLTYHERAAVLICHHCNRRYPIPTVCPRCGSKRIKYFGAGTQRIEETIRELAPHARVLRWDADTTTSKGSHERILEQFASHNADVLVGTQMIAKGLDLPLVTLVGVVAADVALHLPDFRSGERTFQLLTQVSGRAGRGVRAGRVVVQTYNPEHYAIQAAAAHDYEAFYAREIEYRRDLGYPPIQRMARLIVWERNPHKAQSMAERMALQLEQRIRDAGLSAESYSMVGPAPAYFARVRGYYRWQVVLRCDDPAAVLRGVTVPFGWRVDVDPVSVL